MGQANSTTQARDQVEEKTPFSATLCRNIARTLALLDQKSVLNATDQTFKRFQSIFEPPCNKASPQAQTSAFEAACAEQADNEKKLFLEKDCEKREQDILKKILETQQTLYEELMANRFRKINILYENSMADPTNLK